MAKVEVLLDRFISDSHATIGRLFIGIEYNRQGILVDAEGNRVERECYILEDEFREIGQKVFGETRIPAGRYRIGVRTVGGFHNRYTKRFKEFHKGMLQIMDVPDFEYILIHPGNDEDDTNGCLLPGVNYNASGSKWSVGPSVPAYKDLYNKLIEAALAGELWITIEDNDRSNFVA